MSDTVRVNVGKLFDEIENLYIRKKGLESSLSKHDLEVEGLEKRLKSEKSLRDEKQEELNYVYKRIKYIRGFDVIGWQDTDGSGEFRNIDSTDANQPVKSEKNKVFKLGNPFCRYGKSNTCFEIMREDPERSDKNHPRFKPWDTKFLHEECNRRGLNLSGHPRATTVVTLDANINVFERLNHNGYCAYILKPKYLEFTDDEIEEA